ncbi:MAG: hypothetical protein V5A62_06065 [Haloarculaceae archaeon]
MELTPSLVEQRAREYREAEMLYETEREHLEDLPRAFADGEYGWRDAEWVVQWYFRRYLGAYPNVDRRAGESAYGENDVEDVREALSAAGSGTDEERVRRLTTLDGVDVRVASAFLQFLSPDEYVVVGEREWAVLRAADELAAPYPDPPDVEDYLAYLETCREVADRCDCDLWTLYMALWRLWNEIE